MAETQPIPAHVDTTADRSVDAFSYAAALALVCEMYSALDQCNADLVVRCFTDDGSWHRVDGVKTGADALRAVVRERPVDQITGHCVSNLRVHRDGATYIAEYYLTVFGSSPQSSAHLFSLLQCIDELVDVNGLGLRIQSKRTKVRMKFKS